MKSFEFLKIISDGLSFLQPKEKKKLFNLFLLAILCSGIDTLTLTLIAPVIGVIVNPDPWFANYYFKMFLKIIGTDNVNFVIFITALMFCIGVLFSLIFNIFLKYRFLIFSTECRNRYAEELSSRILDAPYFWLNNKNAILNAKVKYLYAMKREWRTNITPPPTNNMTKGIPQINATISFNNISNLYNYHLP